MADVGYKLAELAAAWSWLFDPADYELLEISPFGDLVLRDQTGAICLLDVNMGEIVNAKESGTDPATLFPFAFDDQLASRYRDAGLFLADGKCYGYKLPVITAESSYQPDNVYVATLVEYVSFMGTFHFQIQDVEDGGKARLKIINLPN